MVGTLYALMCDWLKCNACIAIETQAHDQHSPKSKHTVCFVGDTFLRVQVYSISTVR